MKALSLLLPLVPLAALPSFAGFAQVEQRIALTVSQESATVVFATNDGTTVTKAKPDCSCTTVRLDGSRLIAQVDASAFDASIDKHIDATTSDGKRTRLTMHFEVPPAILISPTALVWERNAAPAPQCFRIRLPKASPIRALTSAGISGDDFDFSTRTITPGSEYEITVTPRSTARRALNRLVLHMDGPTPRFQQRILYIRVR